MEKKKKFDQLQEITDCNLINLKIIINNDDDNLYLKLKNIFRENSPNSVHLTVIWD